MHLTKSILKQKFQEYNQLYFDGELPMPIFSLIQSDRLAGQFCARWGRRDGVLQLVRKEIQIVENIQWTERDLRAVMVHEMIHYYVELRKKKPRRDGDFQHWGLFWWMKVRLNWRYHLGIRNSASHLQLTSHL